MRDEAEAEKIVQQGLERFGLPESDLESLPGSDPRRWQLPTPFTKARQPCKAGRKFRRKDFDPGGTGKATSEDKPRAKELLETGIQALAGLQDVLYAQERKSPKRQMFM